jgi:hypothetical protein
LHPIDISASDLPAMTVGSHSQRWQFAWTLALTAAVVFHCCTDTRLVRDAGDVFLGR